MRSMDRVKLNTVGNMPIMNAFSSSSFPNPLRLLRLFGYE